MKFKEFITTTESQNFDLKHFVRDCSEFLNEIRGISSKTLLWHGTYNFPDDWRILTLRDKRQPRDTSLKQHDRINDFFEKKFGWRAREAGIFAVGEAEFAKTFGYEATAIFPIGNFKFLWSPDIKDATTIRIHNRDFDKEEQVDDSALADRDKTALSLVLKTPSQEKRDDIKFQIIQKARWHFNTNLKDALESGNEIIVHANSFYQFYFYSKTFNDVVIPYLKNEKVII